MSDQSDAELIDQVRGQFDGIYVNGVTGSRSRELFFLFSRVTDRLEALSSQHGKAMEALALAEAHFAGEPFDPSARECLAAARAVLHSARQPMPGDGE